ncbi:uncharacterized protein PG998_003474 [Apiospora kogelbergensis]|uniref:uncharacterized protein n=1 Tax=Apiospora kogelbergensis TaxID=1337665 RepID=UPI00312D16EB
MDATVVYAPRKGLFGHFPRKTPFIGSRATKMISPIIHSGGGCLVEWLSSVPPVARRSSPAVSCMIPNRATSLYSHSMIELTPTSSFDGASLPPAYDPPPFIGPEPEANIGGGKIYHGSCHCGAVTFALKSQPLNSSYSSGMAECNCSICSRLGVAWLYPRANQTVMNGQDHLTYYIMGSGMLAKGFCEICGVPIDNKFQELNSSETSRLSSRNQSFYATSKDG